MTRTTIKTALAAGLFLVAIAVVFYACKPDVMGGGLGAKPKADFVVVQGSSANNLVLVNKSSVASIPYWKVVNAGYPKSIQKMNGDSAKFNFIFAGTYNITLLVAGDGGLDSTTKQIVIAQNDPNACNNTAIGFLTGCGTKTWKLNPAAAAYQVGPNPDDGSWWSNGTGDVSLRSCEFDDTYTFTFSPAYPFVYNNQGDFYADGYMGANGNDCESNSQFTASQTPWGSGSFTYTVVEKTGVKSLGQITVSGLGAHIGLQKVTNAGEITSGAVATSITYDILSMTHDPGGFDLLKVTVQLPGANAGFWTFTLRSY